MEQFRSDRQREGACSSAGKGVAGLYRSFGRARLGLAAVWEEEILREVSRDIASTDFSSQVLTQFSGEFAVLPVSGVRWSDLGDSKRLLAVMSGNGIGSRNGKLIEAP
jgi:hypothetical protein